MNINSLTKNILDDYNLIYKILNFITIHDEELVDIFGATFLFDYISKSKTIKAIIINY